MTRKKVYVLAHVPAIIASGLVMLWVSSIYTGVETYRAFLWVLIGWLIYVTCILLFIAESLYDEDN